MCSRVVFFSVIIMCVQFPFCDVYLCRWHVLSILVWREIPTCKKTNENERQNSFNCVSLLVCFHAFWMCFPFVVCSCVFSICVHVWCFFLWLSCVSNFLFATSICADDMCSRSWFCAKSPHVRKPMKMKDKILSIVFPFWCVFMPFGCVFPLLCVHVFFRYVFTCGVFFCDYHVCPISFLRRLFVQMTCALASLREIPTFKKTNENERQNSFNCVSLFGVFSCLLDVFSLCCVFMCLFDMRSRVVFFSVIIMRVQFPFCDVYLCRWHVLSILVLREIPTCKKTNENERQNSFNCVSLLVCFHAFWMCFPFVVCSCVFSICVHVWCFFLWLSCVSNFLFATSICADDMCSRSWFCAKSPHARKPMKMKDKILSIVFPFWCVFMPFGCVFALLCVHVSFRYVFTCGVFFLWLSCVSNFLFATSICADDMCSRSWFCAKSPHVRKPMKMKDKILSIVFPFWCVFMPFGCVFPLLCVHVSFRYVFTCGVFFCDYHVCPISFLRHLFVQMTCALDLGFARNPHMQENQWKWKTKFFQLCFPFGVFSCLLDVFSLCCVFMCLFDMCSRVVFFFCDYHVCPISFLRRLFVQMTCALDLGFARNPHM